MIRVVQRRHIENGKQKDNLIKTYLRFHSGENRWNYLQKDLLLCPDKRFCFLAGLLDATLLRGWLRGVSYLSLVATIRYSGSPQSVN